MPYKVHTKDGNPYCVEKLNGKDVGCSDKEHIGAYLGKLNSVAENEIENDNEDKTNFEKGYNALIKFLNNKKVETSNVYKILTSGKKLSKDDKKELVKFAVTLSQTAIFLLPGGSIPILAYNLIKKKKETKQPEEIMENKLVGGRADNETVKDIAKKFRVTVKYLKKQLKKGIKVESEHTDDKEKQKEIASDHLAEFPNYYEELEGVEKKLKDYWKDKLKNEENMNESKILIKKLLRENFEQASIEQQIRDLGYNPEDVNVIFEDEMQNEGLGTAVKKTFRRFKTYAQAVAKPVIVCGVLAGSMSCEKNNPYVYKFSYHIDKLVTYTLKQDTELDNNLKLDAGQQFGIMDGEVYSTNNNSKLPENMQKEIFDFIKNNPDLFTNNSAQQYNPQEQVGSWYFLEKDVLPETEREVREDKLAAQEEVRLTGKDYTITDEYTLELIGQSKHGDIETK